MGWSLRWGGQDWEGNRELSFSHVEFLVLRGHARAGLKQVVGRSLELRGEASKRRWMFRGRQHVCTI